MLPVEAILLFPDYFISSFTINTSAYRYRVYGLDKCFRLPTLNFYLKYELIPAPLCIPQTVTKWSLFLDGPRLWLEIY